MLGVGEQERRLTPKSKLESRLQTFLPESTEGVQSAMGIHSVTNVI